MRDILIGILDSLVFTIQVILNNNIINYIIIYIIYYIGKFT